MGVAMFGQVRLHNALIALPGARSWQSLYRQLAIKSQPNDVLFVQDSFGSQLSYSLDKSRIVRYHWSPRPIPLDDTSTEWVKRYAQPRVWLASGVSASLDRTRGIERWLAADSAKLVDLGFEDGPRLAYFERTPSTLIETAVDLAFGDEVRLVRYAHTDGSVIAGSNLHLVFTWQALTRPSFDYSVFVHLLDPDGQIYRQVDGSPVSGFRPMSTWAEDETIVDRYGFWLPDDCPVGSYRLVMGVYRWDTLERLSIVDSERVTVGDALDLSVIDVRVGR
jgi:hypothetical protein